MVSRLKTLESIVGANQVFSPEQLPEPWPQQLAEVLEDPSDRPWLVCPNTREELGAVMACAAQERWRVLPAGRGYHLSWGGYSPQQAPVDLVLSTQNLDRFGDYAQADLVLTVEAGVSLQQTQAYLEPQGQFLPVGSTCGDACTLGGLVATADTGAIRHRYGGVRDLLLGIEFVRWDGQTAKAGGRVVKNVAGYDLMKLFTGSYGSLGIMTQLTFRLYPQPNYSSTILIQGAADALQTLTQGILGSTLTPVAMTLLSAGSWAGDSIMIPPGNLALALRFASLEASVKAQIAQVNQWAKAQGLGGQVLPWDHEGMFWQGMTPGPRSNGENRVLCKLGVLPERAIAVLASLDTLVGAKAQGLIQVGSGLGWVQFDPIGLRSPVIQTLRHHCEQQGGFLTLLEGSIFLKQQIDVWGHRGNTLPLMARLKQEFDPHQLLSPHRFLV